LIGCFISNVWLAHVQVFDERAVRNLHSGDWKDREQGLKSVARAVSNPRFQDTAEAFHVATQITANSIK
jgi:hypothetical protein